MTSIFNRPRAKGDANVDSSAVPKRPSEFAQRLQRVKRNYPAVGSMLVMASTVAAAVSSNVPTILGITGIAAVGATGAALHSTSTQLQNINAAINHGVSQVSTMTHDSEGHAYIAQLSSSLSKTDHALSQIEQTRLLERIGQIDFEIVNRLLERVGSANLDQTFGKLTRLVEKFDQLTVSADLHFGTLAKHELERLDQSGGSGGDAAQHARQLSKQRAANSSSGIASAAQPAGGTARQLTSTNNKPATKSDP